MPLFAPRECIEPDAPDPTGLPLSAGHTDTTAVLRSFVGQTGRLFADPAAGLRSGGIKPLRNQHPAPRIRYSATAASRRALSSPNWSTTSRRDSASPEGRNAQNVTGRS